MGGGSAASELLASALVRTMCLSGQSEFVSFLRTSFSCFQAFGSLNAWDVPHLYSAEARVLASVAKDIQE